MVSKLLDCDALEKFLLKNWTQVISPNHMTSFVLKECRDADLPVVRNPSYQQRTNIQFKLSRFTPHPQGFLVWVEFVVPRDEVGTAVGTCELILDRTGEIVSKRTLGNVFTA